MWEGSLDWQPRSCKEAHQANRSSGFPVGTGGGEGPLGVLSVPGVPRAPLGRWVGRRALRGGGGGLG